ncbi:MAG: bifunctional 5,10-methylenetetrahydrofolate dehydrogenase/5,10-methenyltetrahydrofolate cyclohydrolase [Planctomycetia bacterium]|nr:bifunctional 5,10-methylenetetrahydrofolate dehydrogenase/5,10-methenyltetrahydrofolate cyclohydrolase [Planctomycetia bacterium]
MPATIIDGRQIAEKLRADIARDAAEFHAAAGIAPHLAAVLLGDDPASAVYVKNKRLACEKAGLKSTLIQLPAATTQGELLAVVERLNADVSVHGILVQLPLPKQIHPQPILDAVAPLKDVDCFHPENVGLLSQGRPRFLPCTPSGVQQILIHAGVKVPGSHVAIVGRSDLVGRPLALMLMQKGPAADATVTVCHSRTRDLAQITRTADILVAAMGQPEFIKAEMVKPGAVVIDVGTTRVGERIVGDVDFARVSEVAAAITPVPRGVGPMTITMLLANTVAAARLHGASQ